MAVSSVSRRASPWRGRRCLHRRGPSSERPSAPARRSRSSSSWTAPAGQTGHTSARLRVPEHLHLLFLPPYSSELQPAEYLWPLTNAVLVNQHFASIEEPASRSSKTPN